MIELFGLLVIFGLAAYGAYSLFTNRAAVSARILAEARVLEAQAKNEEHTLTVRLLHYGQEVENKVKAEATKVVDGVKAEINKL
jgi:ferredoxin-fold anticodon binding domain-containing protein